MARAGVRGFSDGMISDAARHLIPESALWNAEDVVFDEHGAVRRRGGMKMVAMNKLSPFRATLDTFKYRACMYLRSDYDDRFETLYYADENPAYWRFSQSNAGITVLYNDGYGSINVEGPKITGRPFEYWNVGIQPIYSPNPMGGIHYWLYQPTLIQADANFNFSVPANYVVTAGSPMIPVTSADRLNFRIGRFVHMYNASNEAYTGRIVDVDYVNSRIFVSPTPQVGFTALGGLQYSDVYAPTTLNALGQGSMCGCAYGGRILFGGTGDRNAATGVVSPRPNRLMWSILPDEIATLGAYTYRGTNFMGNMGFTQYSQLDVPDISRIVGLEAQGDNTVYIFAEDSIYALIGSLSTMTDSRGSITFDISKVTNQVGCANDHTIKATRHGIVFADAEGIYIMGESGPQSLIGKKVERLYGKMVEKDGANILAGAYVGEDHYMLATTNGSLLVDIKDGKWSRMKNIRFYSSWRDKQNDKVYASHDGHISRIDSVLDEQVIRDEYAMLPVESVIETKAFDLGTLNLKKFKRAKFDYSFRSARQESRSIIGFNTDLSELVYLPNGDVELSNTKWWKPIGSALPTIAAIPTVAYGGNYVLSVTPSVANSGAQYDLPPVASKLNFTSRVFFEALVATSYATTMAMTASLGAGFAVVTNYVPLTPATWTRIVVSVPVTSTQLLEKNKILFESSSGSHFLIAKLSMFYAEPWQIVGSNDNIANLDTTTVAPGKKFSLKCDATAASAGQGVGIYLDNFVVKANRRYKARFRVKSLSDTQALEIHIGGDTQSVALPIVATNDGFADFEANWTPNLDQTFFRASVRTMTPVAATFWVQDVKLWEEEPQMFFAGVAGIDGQGDFGDSFTREDWEHADIAESGWEKFANHSESDWLILNSGLHKDTAIARQLIKKKDITKFKNGRHRAKIRVPANNDSAGEFIIGLRYLPGVTHIGLAAHKNRTETFRHTVGMPDFQGDQQAGIQLNTPLEGGQEVWLDLELLGRTSRAKYYYRDPAVLSNPIIQQGEYYFNLTEHEELDYAGYPYIDWSNVDYDGYIDWNEIEPYDNLGTVDPQKDRNATSHQGNMYVISEALTLKLRTVGDSMFKLRGINIEADVLNEFRTV